MKRFLGFLGEMHPHGLSLRRLLLVYLLLPQLVLWLAGGIATYKLASGYANLAIDASLAQASRALARQLKPIGDGLLIDFPRAAQDILEADPTDRLLYTVSTPPGQFILGNENLSTSKPIATPRLNDPYYYDVVLPPGNNNRSGLEHVRVSALYLAYGESKAGKQTMLVQVARNSANREAMTRRILFDTLLPLSVLILLMSMIVSAGIRAGLAPLNRLRHEVEERAPGDLTPLKLDSAPEELQSLARSLNELLASVQRNVIAQKRFIGDAAHQLRTPLAGLKSQTELALQNSSDPEQRQRLERVHLSATRSAHLVTQLLTLARADPESAMVQDRSTFDLQRFANDVVAEWVPRALKCGVDLGMNERYKAAVPVKANALLLREALANLLDNAIHYAGRHAEVTVLVRADGLHARLEVEDTGPGIRAEDRERAMERFVRITDAGNGCGLGLPIVKEIVERHAGSVALEQVQPRGLRVIVRLPLAA
ncbi:sensor histidine kinase [Pelomonas sp. KK5]|uniref:sensor histidine kinase n=1 Tax=Pelomonas sp. KK5 TaxID=1855730 RepID=UPI001E56B3D4|nr:sensor histidine kinase [Pelomonas sp. KK5]